VFVPKTMDSSADLTKAASLGQIGAGGWSMVDFEAMATFAAVVLDLPIV
jgi:hypothetical protein